MTFDNSFVDQIKNSVDIVRVISEYVRLRKSGANYSGLCPFHSEKTPSFHVHSGRQLYHCFGCHAGGDVFKFIQSIERITFPETLKLLAEKCGIALPRSDFGGELEQTAKERLALFDVNDRAARIFRSQLHNSSEGKQALNYLKERGVTEEMIDRFEIGYSLAASDGLTRKLLNEFSSDLMFKSGLVQSSDYDSRTIDRFRRRIMFPIRSEVGKIIGFGGRILGEGQPKYLNSPETSIYSKGRTLYALNQARESIRRKNFVILVEGYMDCIALHQAGVNNVVASCGTSLTEGQAKLLSRLTDRIVVNFDPDSAGAAATIRSLDIFLGHGFNIKVLALPGGDDPDAFVRKKGAESYQALLEKAPSYFNYLVEKAQKENNLKAVEGKIAAVNMLLPYLARIPNRIERVEQTRRVAETFGVEESVIREELKTAANQNREKSGVNRTHFKIELKPSEKYLLKAILEDDPTAAEIIAELLASQVYVGLQSESIFRELISCYSKEGKINLNRLQESLHSEADKDLLNQALFTELNQVQALRCLEGIKRQKAEREIALLQKQIEQAEVSQDFERLVSLHSKKSELKRMMAG
jgi:DNA primase